MDLLNNLLFYFAYLMESLLCQTVSSIEETYNYSNCREKYRLIGSKNEDMFKTIDVHLEKIMKLDCFYCNGIDDQQPKVWFKQNRLINEPPKEIELGLESRLSENRVYMTLHHQLVVQNVSSADAGAYYCHGLDGIDAEYKFNYMVDVINVSTGLLAVDMKSWRLYEETLIIPLNKEFESSNKAEFVQLRDTYNVLLRVVSEWEKWQPCDGCQRLRKRYAYCRLKPKPFKQESHVDIDNGTKLSEINNLLLNSFELSCHSMQFANMFAEISARMSRINNFVQTEPCLGSCRVTSSNDKWPRYRNRYTLVRGAHLTLVCPESSIESNVKWLKDGYPLRKGKKVITKEGEEPRIFVDSFSTVYLFDVTKQESGNYSCFVNSKRIQEIIVIVLEQSIMRNSEFVRHMTYLAFIILFSFLFYAAGLAIAYSKRKTFKRLSEIPLTTSF